MRNVSGRKTFLTVLVSQKEINKCSNRRMQEALQNAGTGSRGSEESSDRAGLGCIWVTHRKVWAEEMDHIQMHELIQAANDKMPFHKVFGSYTGGDPESKFGNKLAAYSQSAWVLDEGSWLCLCEKSPRTQVLPIMKREFVLQHVTQWGENCQRGLSGTDRMWWVNTKNSRLYQHLHLGKSILERPQNICES